jgi:hypothetical protein
VTAQGGMLSSADRFRCFGLASLVMHTSSVCCHSQMSKDDAAPLTPEMLSKICQHDHGISTSACNSSLLHITITR